MNTEPVLILAAVNALIALAVGFGLHITVAQGSLIDAAVTAILALVLRSKVTPTANVATTVDLSKVGKAAILLALLLGGGVTLPACAPPVTITTPQGKVAYTADQIVVRVNELEHAVAGANAVTPPAISTVTAATIMRFCVSANVTLAATPSGWQTTLQQAWIVAKQQVGIQSNPAIIAAMSAVDVALGVVQ